jgi:hypothetical protein
MGTGLARQQHRYERGSSILDKQRQRSLYFLGGDPVIFVVAPPVFAVLAVYVYSALRGFHMS